MRGKIIIFLSIFVWAAAGQAKDVLPQETVSKINSVTVYSDRALVKRFFSAELPAGFVSLIVPDLPSKMLNESVRVGGKGTSAATISGVRVEEEYLEESARAIVRDLEKGKAEVEDRIKTLGDRKGVLDEKKKFIMSLSQKTTQSISENLAVQRPSLEEWVGMVAFIDQSLNAINVESQSIDKEKAELDGRKAVIDKEMANYQNQSGESRKSVMVDLELDEPGSVSLELAYIVYGATWTPIYDIRASSDNDSIDVIFMANVLQNTGEDWNDVNLELSTAKPFVGAAPRELNPWYLSAAAGNVYEGGAGRDADRWQILGTNDRAPRSPGEMALKQTTGFTQQARYAVADVSQQLISTSFVLKQTETILSDNTPKKVSVKFATTEGKKEYYAVPKLNSYAYLRTMVTNQTNFPLLPGPANVFFDGDFVSTSSIPLVVPSESFEMYLGIDEGIKLKRELVEKFADKTGMLSKKSRVEYSYKITVETYRDYVQKITVIDQVPVSQDDRLEVKVKNVSPEPAYKGDDEKKGILRWVINLEPAGKETLTFNYQILHPPDLVIAGLN